jgi:hypothetical protein
MITHATAVAVRGISGSGEANVGVSSRSAVFCPVRPVPAEPKMTLELRWPRPAEFRCLDAAAMRTPS